MFFEIVDYVRFLSKFDQNMCRMKELFLEFSCLMLIQITLIFQSSKFLCTNMGSNAAFFMERIHFLFPFTKI
jgi:hypothetical protein